MKPPFLGGESLTQLDGVRSQLNFVGCLQQLTFNKMKMLKDAKADSMGYSVHGRLDWMCSNIQWVIIQILYQALFHFSILTSPTALPFN